MLYVADTDILEKRPYMVIIDFLDYNVIDTLVLVKTMRPSSVYLLADKTEANGKRARHLSNAVKDICPDAKVEIRAVDTKEILDAVGVVGEIAKTDDTVYLNIDADHGISTAVGFSRAESEKVTPVCVDMKNEIIRDLITLETIADVKHISLTDYLNAIGAKQLSDSHDLPTPDEYDEITGAAEVLFKDVNVWNILCSYIGRHYSHESKRVRIPTDLDGEINRNDIDAVREQLDAFCKFGFLRHVVTADEGSQDVYEFTSERHKNYMVVFGIWLEMYMYIKLQPYFDEVYCGFVIDWDGFDDYDTKDNEIDVVAIRKSRPVMISCKMRMPVKEDIYEIGYISEMLGGSLVIPAVATSAIVERKQTYKPGLYPRFSKMNVGLIETYAVKKQGIEQVIKDMGIDIE